MTPHRRAVLALGAVAVLPGCTAGFLEDSQEQDPERPVVLSNRDTEPHWLAVKVRGDEQSSYVHEFAAYLEADDSAEVCEHLPIDDLEGDEFELELRLDDEVRTDSISRHSVSHLSIRITEGESIVYGTAAR